MTDTLQCGHPASYLYRHPSVGYGCIACHQTPIAIRRYAGELCGIVVTESDPIEFAKAIVDDPDDRLPRLVFADWLDEQGDPRGELIRVEAELHRLEWCPLDERLGTNTFTQLCIRRAALRRQLGYDQSAEPDSEIRQRHPGIMSSWSFPPSVANSSHTQQ